MNRSEADSESADRWRRLDTIFADALELPPAERAPFVSRATDDPALASAVMDLLAASTSAPDAVRDIIAREASRFSEEAAGLSVGARLHAYRIVGKLGEGGMGIVYLAELADDARRPRVAIKILLSPSAQAVARFRDEHEILASLDHPAIVRVRGAGHTETGLPYLVMDYIDGVPLTRFARALTTRQRLELFIQVCDAVQYAHDKLVIHRDLKPSNILVTPDGRAHLLDFGIAKLLDPPAGVERHAHTRTGMPLLTPEYASPEQARGGPLTQATDIYSLGAVLYELLAGQAVVEATADPFELLRRICEREPTPPSQVVATTSQRQELAGALDAIVLRALAKDPAERYASARELAAAVEHHLMGSRAPDVTTHDDRATARSNAGSRRLTKTRVLIIIALLATAAWIVARVLDAPAVEAPAPSPPRLVATPAADPAPKRVELDAGARRVVLKDQAGGVYVVVPGPGGRAFYAAPSDPTHAYEQIVVQRSTDPTRDSWSVSIWTPMVPGRQPGSIVRDADGQHLKWCGERRTALTEVTGNDARTVLAGVELMSTRFVRRPYLLARDALGVYYLVDVIRDGYGGGGHRLLVGPKGALRPLALGEVVTDEAGDVFATQDGELRVARVARPGQPEITWVHRGKQVPLAALDLDANGAFVFGELGVYSTTGTLCDSY